jgi:carbamoyl-phosphate synthase small subunit
VAICDVDTRALVKRIRERGAMNAIISTETLDVAALKQQLANVPSMEGLELSSEVCAKESFYFGDEDATYRVAAFDFGIKKNILRCLADRDCYVKVFPSTAKFEELAAWNPDGYFLSNGPGDPAAMPHVVEEVRKVIGSHTPVFGICLGHQMIALASGLHTYKMHNGHRGINHPVKNLLTGKGEVTSQNHGFAVNMDDVLASETVELTHIHLNDNTVAGIRRNDTSCFSVQFHPEASPGPHDSRYLFDDFIENIKNYKN